MFSKQHQTSKEADSNDSVGKRAIKIASLL